MELNIVQSESLSEGFEKSHYKEDHDSILNREGQQQVTKHEIQSPWHEGGLRPRFIARKTIDLKEIESRREAQLLKECKHENILKGLMWEEWKSMNGQINYINLYTEWCQWNLKTFLTDREANNRAPLTLKDFQWMSMQMISGIKFLHDINVIHRDIKPENILVSSRRSTDSTFDDVVLKIADFGLARWMSLQASSSSVQVTACGTRNYASPEMLKAMEDYKNLPEKFVYASDVFSLGVVFFEMLAKDRPFTQDDLRKPFIASALVKNHPFPKNTRTYFELVDKECKLSICQGLIKMLQYESASRPSAKELADYFDISIAFTEVVSQTSIISRPVLNVAEEHTGMEQDRKQFDNRQMQQRKRLYCTNRISCLHYIDEARLLVVGCDNGSIFTLKEGGKELEEIANKQRRDDIFCMRHHDEFLLVGSQNGSLSLWRTGGDEQLQFVTWVVNLGLQAEIISAERHSVDISELYIVSGCDTETVKGTLTVWKRNPDQPTMTSLHSKLILNDIIHSILIHQDRFYCGIGTDNLVIFEAKSMSKLRTINIGGPACSLCHFSNQVYAAVWTKGIFCVDQNLDVKRFVIWEETADRPHQIVAQQERLYCWTEHCGLKSFSIDASRGSMKWAKDGEKLKDAEKRIGVSYRDMFQLSHSNLYYFSPEHGNSVHIH